MTPSPASAASATFAVLLLGVGALTTVLDVASQGTLVWIVWVLCMTPPLLVLPALAAHAAVHARRRADGVGELAQLEADGPLVGRTGILGRDRNDQEYPVPPERRGWHFVDGTLRLPVVARPETTRQGDTVRIVTARPLRTGEVPFVESGVGVEVVGCDG